MRIVFDLDGTLADGTHREHFITGKNHDWDAYFEACDGDTLIWPVINTFIALHEGIGRNCHRHIIEIWSGRHEGENKSVRRKTVQWLYDALGMSIAGIRENGPHPDFFYSDPILDLRMRPYKDYTPDQDLKKAWLDAARAQGREPHLVFDDRQKVVDMWRAEGIPCFQVAPGDF